MSAPRKSNKVSRAVTREVFYHGDGAYYPICNFVSKKVESAHFNNLHRTDDDREATQIKLRLALHGTHRESVIRETARLSD